MTVIKFYPKARSYFKLTLLETILYGYIDGMVNNQVSFYFTNQQLAECVGRSERLISRAMHNLVKKGAIKVSIKSRFGGGKVKFVEKVNNYK